MAALSERVALPPALVRWWAGKAPGERRIVGALALLVIATLAWLGVWRPLQRDVGALRETVAAERAALVDGERMAAEIAALARAAPLPPAPEAPAALERVLSERGLGGGAAQVEWRDGRAHVVLESVRFDTLIGALDVLQREARLRVVEAVLTGRVEPGTVRAEFVVAR